MTRPSTRRQYLFATAATGIAALAGCSDVIEDYDEAEGTPDENSSDANSSEEDANETDDEPVENVDYENPDGELAFVQPEDGAEVSSPVSIEMEVENFELRPVGEDTTAEDGAGHLHVLVDEGCVEPSYVIPEEDGFHHLSDGETEIELDLEPGEHDLCAQAGDAQHNAYAMTDEITIEVTEGDDGNETDGDENETES